MKNLWIFIVIISIFVLPIIGPIIGCYYLCCRRNTNIYEQVLRIFIIIISIIVLPIIGPIICCCCCPCCYLCCRRKTKTYEQINIQMTEKKNK